MSNLIDQITRRRFRDGFQVQDQYFTNEKFDFFYFTPTREAQGAFKNCRFSNCEIVRGAFNLGSGVELDSVLFENFSVNGRIEIHSDVKMKNATITSSDPKIMMWIRNSFDKQDCSDNTIELDVSSFSGELIITGNDVSKVITSPDKHVFISRALVDHDLLKLDRENYFRSSATKVKRSGVEWGVFSLPMNRINREGFDDQLEYFMEKGYVKSQL